MKNIIRFITLLSVCGTVLWRCNPQESEITPLGIEEKYSLSQGNHEFDNKLVEFYDSTGVYILYQYDSLDAIWNITGLYPNTNYPLRIVLPDEEYLSLGIQMIFENWLDLYPMSTLKSTLPKKILLADSIFRKSSSTGEASLADYTYTFDNICVGNINESLNDVDEKEYKAMLNLAYITYCIDYGKIEVPKAFYEMVDYSHVNAGNFTTFGIIKHSNNMGAKEDMLAWLEMLFTEDQFMIDEYWFNPSDDFLFGGMDGPSNGNGLYRKRCGILVTEMKRLYNIDMEELTGLTLK